MGASPVLPTMASVTTLLALVEALARDPEAKADYAAGPDAFLQRHGFGDLSPADVNEAVLHASNTLPAPAAAQVEPDGGLDSVAAVDPTAFEPEPGADYEEDLFGHDPGDGFDDAVSGADGDEGATDEVDELAAAHGPADHDGTDPDHPTQPEPADAHGEDSTDDGDDGDDAGPTDLAADAPAGTPGSSLASLPDPHDLDGDRPAPDAAATLETAQDHTAVSDAAVGSDDAADDDGPTDLFDQFGADDAGGFDQALGADDPFASPEPLGSDPWYDDSTASSFAADADLDVDEPDEDILDDVDDMDLTD